MAQVKQIHKLYVSDFTLFKYISSIVFYVQENLQNTQIFQNISKYSVKLLICSCSHKIRLRVFLVENDF